MAAPQDILQKYLKPGLLISNRYALEKVIGVGAYGAVWSAIDQTCGERVAVKALPPASENSSRTALGRFQREMKIISSVVHPNIITIYDYGQTEHGVPYMVLEYLDGVTLDVAVRDRPMQPEQGMRVMRQLLGALHVAHEKGVIHRDLKPANIMLTQDKGELQVKILDFGMAKALSSIDGEEVVQLTREGVAVGTPRYIAPEQARGLQVGPYTDLYAVGLLIYEVFTGCRAVKADTIEMAVMAHVSPDPLYLPEIELVPAKLHPLLHKLLAKPVNARYQSAAHVLHDLDQIEGRQAPILTNRMPALLAPPRTGPQQAIGAPSQEPEKLELAIPRPITGSMQAVSATRPEDQRPHIEVRREAGSFAQSHGHLVEYLLSPALMSVSFILITAHFYKLPSALRGFTWVIPVIAILIVNTLTGPAWRQPAVRAVNVYSALAILVAHMMGIRALGASLMHQPSWFLSPMLAVPGVQPLVRLIDALFYHYGRFLTAL